MTDGELLLATALDSPEDNAPWLIYADWLNENDRPEESARVREMRAVIMGMERSPSKWGFAADDLCIPELSGYDWREAFQYANKPMSCGPTGTHNSPFNRHWVAEVLAKEEGESDGPHWICVGRLWDGRWFSLSAGCDYTGWDCQAGGDSSVAANQEEIVRFGLTSEERVRLGLALLDLDHLHLHGHD